MIDPKKLSDYPITKRWPAQNPDVIQLYSYPTPNGVKVSIALEEMGLPYEAHKVTLSDADVKSEEFLSLNPNNKIPAIIDPVGPDGDPIGLFETGAILLYLSDKTGKFIGATERDRAKIIQWLMFQMGGIGPMFGQLGFFVKFKGAEIEDPRPRERYIAETKRLLNVLDGVLADRDWIAGDYSIADIAIAPWLRPIGGIYEATDLVDFDSYTNVVDYLKRFMDRPAVQKGINIPSRD
ncbi:glutathione S-transferase [Cohaesibacter marisflavi]|uniref:Glutathione S-transferase n=1 Tax=Cohaesibacter marisflavi TaxID=655353 RepID=A0A1I5DEZ7_9HYPH|nr:glutathione S-transferase N-terminal domain-containing protein [Cohaesibacter marisflavi]SFN97839.1 glutathione S-transferase [Cohaesibacter marisflavi]